MPRLLTVYGLSRELGISVESLRRWMDDGLIPPVRRNGHAGRRFFTEREAKEIRRALVARRLGRPSPVRSAWRLPRV